MKTTDLDTRKRLTRRPRNKVVTSAEYSTGKVAVGIEHIFVSSRYDSASNRDLPSYSLVNLRASYTFRKFLTIFARLENLFDKNYEEAGGYGAPGLAAYGGIRVSF
jgi:vitamin B12 transporter